MPKRAGLPAREEVLRAIVMARRPLTVEEITDRTTMTFVHVRSEISRMLKAGSVHAAEYELVRGHRRGRFQVGPAPADLTPKLVEVKPPSPGRDFGRYPSVWAYAEGAAY